MTVQNPNFLTFKEPHNRYQGTNPAMAELDTGRYDNPILTRFLAPIACLKIPAHCSQAEMLNSTRGPCSFHPHLPLDPRNTFYIKSQSDVAEREKLR
jgi:hypothetical protein